MTRALGAWVLPLGVLACVAGLQVRGYADDPAAAPPDPAITLEKASKLLDQTVTKGSLRAKVLTEGGIALHSDHKIAATSVTAIYEGEILKGQMRVAEVVDAYRTEKRGAIRNKQNNTWQDIHASKDGQILARLFPFPNDVLGRALRDAEKIEWLPDSEPAPASPAPEKKDEPETPAAPKGSTRVDPRDGAGGATGVDGNALRLPRRARVTIKPELAVHYYNEAKNSGCLDAG